MKTMDLPEDFDLPEDDEKPLSGIIKPKLIKIKKKKVRLRLIFQTKFIFYTGYLTTECGFCRPWCAKGMHVTHWRTH